jgi:hypothetical protein
MVSEEKALKAVSIATQSPQPRVDNYRLLVSTRPDE